jgi:GNAT superfamily N-acetyltransferase
MASALFIGVNLMGNLGWSRGGPRIASATSRRGLPSGCGKQMNDPLSIAELKLDPRSAAAELRTASGVPFMLRPLKAGDGRILGAYFLGLSPGTRALYAPHPMDRETADSLCAAAASSDVIRFIAVLPGDGVIAYDILMPGLTDGETERYRRAGVDADPGRDCLVAPSVADAWQGRGVGTPCLRHVISVARRLGRRRLMLMGGFRAVGAFLAGEDGKREAQDMCLDLQVNN